METTTFLSAFPASSSNETENSSTQTIAGTIYLIVGIFGMAENGFAAFLMATDSEMRSPSYYYMINLCLSDFVILIPTYVYCGLALVVPSPIYFLEGVPIRVFAYVTAFSWGACVINTTLASFSRFIQITKPHLMNHYFKRRNIILSNCLAWAIPVFGYGILISTQMTLRIKPFYVISYSLCTWVFDHSQSLGYVFYWITGSYITLAIILIAYFNTLTLLCVRRMRSQVQADIDTNQSREIKLFAQIALSSSFYATCVVIFIVCNHPKHNGASRTASVFSHLLWGLQHLHAPFVYLALNKPLRQRIRKMIFGCERSAE